METQLTRCSIEHYLPIIRAIYASLEVSLAPDDRLENRDFLIFSYLEKEFGISKLLHVTHLLDIWLKGSKFEMKPMRFHKVDKNARWADLLELLDKKIKEYQNDVPIIEIGISRNGRVVRTVAGHEFVHDFKADSIKRVIIASLRDCGGYMKRVSIKSATGSTSIESVSKLIRSINDVLGGKLRLPPKHKFIENKHGSGYRINSIYNLIQID